MLRTLWFLTIVIGIATSAATATWVLFVLQELGVPEAWFGAFMVAGAIGGIVGSILAERMRLWWGTGRTMAAMAILSGAVLLAVGALPFAGGGLLVTAGGALGWALSSLSITVWNILIMSLRQSIVPGHLLGRVHGTWRTLLWGTMPFGSLLGGALALAGLGVPLLVGGAVVVVVSVVFVRFFASLPNPEDVVHDTDAGPTDPLIGS